MKALDTLIPKNFLFKYPLAMGAFIFGVVMVIIMVICIIGTVMQAVYIADCVNCSMHSSKVAYAYCILAVIYSVALFLVSFWYLWGLKRNKASIITGYLVITSIWLIQTAALLIVLIIMYRNEVNWTAWLLCLIFGLLAIFILFYGLLVVYGHWLDIKKLRPSNES